MSNIFGDFTAVPEIFAFRNHKVEIRLRFCEGKRLRAKIYHHEMLLLFKANETVTLESRDFIFYCVNIAYTE